MNCREWSLLVFIVLLTLTSVTDVVSKDYVLAALFAALIVVNVRELHLSVKRRVFDASLRGRA